MDDLHNVSYDLVRTYLKQVKPNKAEGPDDICARILKECEKEISLPLSIIQTEAERRGREAGVQQAIENGLRSCLYRVVHKFCNKLKCEYLTMNRLQIDKIYKECT